ncbi:hypothetical protein BS78_09G083300 [Paspalum vaginatum]|nr:hypothetical protein BS78_09G083300 [Paspalum vaginatum]
MGLTYHSFLLVPAAPPIPRARRQLPYASRRPPAASSHTLRVRRPRPAPPPPRASAGRPRMFISTDFALEPPPARPPSHADQILCDELRGRPRRRPCSMSYARRTRILLLPLQAAPEQPAPTRPYATSCTQDADRAHHAAEPRWKEMLGQAPVAQQQPLPAAALLHVAAAHAALTRLRRAEGPPS